MAREISNSDDTIDSRDIIERIEELETEIADGRQAALNAFDNEPRGEMTADEFANEYVEENLFDEAAELKALLALQADAKDYVPDWEYGAQLIRDSYFVEAMQELCDDIGDFPNGVPSYYVIDWDATARNLRVDYTSVDFDGVTYWVR